jgi:hypothetical protein
LELADRLWVRGICFSHSSGEDSTTCLAELGCFWDKGDHNEGKGGLREDREEYLPGDQVRVEQREVGSDQHGG